MDDDGHADTLRLAYATPRAWLEDGKRIEVRDAPTAFGNVSFAITSHLARGRIDAEITLPDRAPSDIRLRLRLPRGYELVRAESGGRAVNVDRDTLDLSNPTEKSIRIAAVIRKASQR